MSGSPIDIVTIEEAREELFEKGNQYDDAILRRIAALSHVFEAETGWSFKQRVLTARRVDGEGQYFLLLPFVPVQSVSAIEIRSEMTDAVVSTLAPTDFILKDAERGRIQLLNGQCFPPGFRNVLVTMTIGFLATDERLARAKALLLEQLSFDYHTWQNHEQGIVAKSFSDGNVSFAPRTHLLQKVQDGLDALRSWRVM